MFFTVTFHYGSVCMHGMILSNKPQHGQTVPRTARKCWGNVMEFHSAQRVVTLWQRSEILYVWMVLQCSVIFCDYLTYAANLLFLQIVLRERWHGSQFALLQQSSVLCQYFHHFLHRWKQIALSKSVPVVQKILQISMLVTVTTIHTLISPKWQNPHHSKAKS